MSAKFAQHFLINQHACERIVAAMNLSSEDQVLEIGAGRGALTALLVEKAKSVIAVEIDPDLIAYLKTKFAGQQNIQFIESDILDYDFSSLRDFKVVGNLPYNLTSPILRKLCDRTGWSEAYVMVQKEVGERLTAKVNTPAYGALSVGMNLTCEIEPVFVLSETSFKPAPRVKSAVVKLVRRTIPLSENIPLTQRVIQAAFQQRRKTILNALSHGLGIDKPAVSLILKNIGIPEMNRAENISIDKYLLLAKKFVPNIHDG